MPSDKFKDISATVQYDRRFDRLDIVWRESADVPAVISPFTLVWDVASKDWGAVSFGEVQATIAKAYGRSEELEHSRRLQGADLPGVIEFGMRSMRPWKPVAAFFTEGKRFECYWDKDPSYHQPVSREFELIVCHQTDRIVGCEIFGVEKMIGL